MTEPPRFRAAVTVLALGFTAAGCVERRFALASPNRGERSEPIVGGIPELNHRYVVAVGNDTRAFCSGTVISRHTVLTAGHCIGAVTRVYFGPTVAGATTINVVQQVRDPMFADLCDN